MISFMQLREGSLKTAVFTFGRFNPPTIGHEILVDKVLRAALDEKGWKLPKTHVWCK